MRIKALDIYGYGKWVNQRFNIASDLQIIYGPNEAGKSTMQSFIKSILFGFPDRRKRVNKVNRYVPKKGDVYGGRLLVEDDKFGELWIERTSQGLTLMSKDGHLLEEHVLDELLGGLDEKLFDTFYSFNIQNLQELNNIGAEQLNDFFLSIGTLGSDKFLALAKQLEDESDKLYRPTGSTRPLNVMLRDYDQLALKVQEKQQQNNLYNAFIEAREEETEKIHALQEEILTLEKQGKQLEQLIDRYDIYLKDRTALRELSQLTYTPLPPQAEKNVSQAVDKIEEIKTEQTQLLERLKHLEEEKLHLTRYQWAVNHEEERKAWRKATQEVKATQAKIEQVDRLIDENKHNLEQLARRSKFYPEKIKNSDAFLIEQQKGLEIQAEIEKFSEELEKIKTQRKVYMDQRRQQQNNLAQVRQAYTKYEHQRMNEEELLIQETSLKEYAVGFLFSLIGILAYFFGHSRGQQSSGFGLIGLLLLALGLVVSVFTYIQQRKKRQSFKDSPLIQKMEELKKEELTFQEESQVLGAEVNKREDQLNQMERELAALHRDQQQWLVDIGFYPTADAEIVLKTNPVDEYYTGKEREQKYQQERALLEQEIIAWKEEIKDFLERFPAEEHSMRVLIRHVEDVEAELTQTIYQGQEVQHKIDTYEERRNKLAVNLEENNALLEEIFAASAAENIYIFKNKVKVNERYEELQAKRALYKEHIGEHMTEMEGIANKQELQEAYQAIEAEIAQKNEALEPHHTQRANLTIKIQQLEEDGSYQELLQQLEDQETALIDLIQRWGEKRLAMEIIQRTLRKGLDNPIEEMNEIANNIFATLSYGRYKQIKFNKRQIKVVHDAGILFDPHELSQGTLEQLYVALRLAFIISAKSMVEMPILIDDAFVNFDEMRKTSIYQVLEELSAYHQILFFTFDKQALDAFSDEQIIQLESSNIPIEEE